MKAKTAAEVAATDPRLAAMFVELGSARFDDFPMEDGKGGKKGRGSQNYAHPPKLANGGPPVKRAKPVNNLWAKAMARGDFDDDDAAQVAGMDSMDDGQMARNRRYAAGDAMTADIDKHQERSMRRDGNGYIPPRATAPVARRDGSRYIPIGDRPIDVSGGARRAPAAASAIVSRGVFLGGGPLRPSNSQPRNSTARTAPLSATSQPSTVAAVARPPTGRPVAAQPHPVAQSQTNASNNKEKVRAVVLNGASVVLKLPASFGAAVFPQRGGKYHGDVYLVQGSQPSEDMMIIAVEDKSVDKIKHFISEYDTYMSVSTTGIMLKFTNASGGVFYAADFEKADDMMSFVGSVRGLVERAKHPLPNSASAPPITVTSTITGPDQSADKVELLKPATPISHEKAEPVATEAFQVEPPVQDKIGAPSAEPPVDEVESGNESSSVVAAVFAAVEDTAVSAPESELQPVKQESKQTQILRPTSTLKVDVALSSQAARTPENSQIFSAPETPEVLKVPGSSAEQISSQLLEDISEWVWDAAEYMRHSIPEEFGFDTMRAIVDSISAAIMGRKSASFRLLSTEHKQVIVERQIRPHVERAFSQKLAGDRLLVTERAGEERCQTKASQQELLQPELSRTESVQQSSKIKEHGQAQPVARSKASKHTGPVYEIEELKAIGHDFVPDQSGGRLLPDIPRKSKKQPRTRCTKPDLPRTPLEDQLNLNAAAATKWLYVVKDLQQGGVLAQPSTTHGASPKEVELANSKIDTEGDSLTEFLAPVAQQKPGSPPTGLHSSIHNRGNAHSPGQNAGLFTGALGLKKSTHMEELENLVNKQDDENTVYDHKVTETTNAIGRLSLD
ncbi:unnamed protein product [Discula destructiva]